MKCFYFRDELQEKLKSDFNFFLELTKNTTGLTVTQLTEELNKACKQVKKSDKKQGRIDKLDKKIHMLKCEIQGYSIALEICKLYKLQNTTSFSRAMLSDGTIDKIIQSRYEEELEHNKQVEKTNEGYKSFIYQNLDWHQNNAQELKNCDEENENQ